MIRWAIFSRNDGSEVANWKYGLANDTLQTLLAFKTGVIGRSLLKLAAERETHAPWRKENTTNAVFQLTKTAFFSRDLADLIT